MNKYHVIGAIIAFTLLALILFLYRIYKRIGRRCTEKKDRHKDTKEFCGCNLKRVHKILLPEDERISFLSKNGQWRCWIRRNIKLTFTICPAHGVKCVKIDFDILSVFHALWTNWFHREQYTMEEKKLIDAFWIKVKQLYASGGHKTLDGQVTDTPPISLSSIVNSVFEEFSNVIGGE